MDISEIKELKEKLEEEINKLIFDFEEKTELLVTDIEYESFTISNRTNKEWKRENVSRTITLRMEFS